MTLLRRLFTPEGKAEWKQVWDLAWPQALGDTCLASWSLVSVATIGQICGKDAMDAAAVASAFMSLTQMFPYSLASALNTLCSQARGAGNTRLVGIWLQTGLIFYTATIVPLFALWWFTTEPALEAIGLSHERAHQAQRYARYSIPVSYCVGLKFCVEQYYAALGVVMPSTVCSMLSTAASVGLSMLLMEGAYGWDGLGFVGSPIALGICTLLQIVLFIGYCSWRKLYGDCWHGWDLKGATRRSRMREYFVMAAPNALGSFIENGQMQVCHPLLPPPSTHSTQVIMAFVTYMGSSSVAAWSCVDTIWMLVMAGSMAFCKAINLRVSYHLGADDVPTIHLAIASGVIGITVLSLICGGILVGLREKVGRIYTQDKEVVSLVADLVPWMSMAFAPLAIGLVSVFVLDAQGRPGVGAFILAGVAWCINVPFSALGTYKWHRDLVFILQVMIAGYCVAVIGGWYAIFTSNWEKLVADAKRRSEMDGASASGSVDGDKARINEDGNEVTEEVSGDEEEGGAQQEKEPLL